jgi:hypothetical protein
VRSGKTLTSKGIEKKLREDRKKALEMFQSYQSFSYFCSRKVGRNGKLLSISEAGSFPKRKTFRKEKSEKFPKSSN